MGACESDGVDICIARLYLWHGKKTLLLHPPSQEGTCNCGHQIPRGQSDERSGVPVTRTAHLRDGEPFFFYQSRRGDEQSVPCTYIYLYLYIYMPLVCKPILVCRPSDTKTAKSHTHTHSGSIMQKEDACRRAALDISHNDNVDDDDDKKQKRGHCCYSRHGLKRLRPQPCVRS